MKPEKITDPRQIVDLANEGKAIFHKGWGRASPAAFFLGWPLRTIMMTIGGGCLEIYQGKDHPGTRKQNRITKAEKLKYGFTKNKTSLYGALLPTKTT